MISYTINQQLMLQIPVFEQLYRDGAIDVQELNRVKEHKKNAPVSVRSDLLFILYLGIFCVVTALGILIYKNIESIGHLAITGLIATTMAGCFWYCFNKATGFSYQKVLPVNIWFDYVLLTGCLLLLILVAYLQFQYNVFGNSYGLATFLPMVILFVAAYYFDHLGVLSLAITNLATWAGIVITPSQLLLQNDFSSYPLIYSGIALGVLLLVAAFLSVFKNIKAHFAFTYKNFGFHLLIISLLAAEMVIDKWYLLWFLLVAAVCYFQFRQAIVRRSFYFLLMTTLYIYVGLSYVLFKVLLYSSAFQYAAFNLFFLYIIISAVGLVMFLIRYNNLIKKYDSLS